MLPVALRPPTALRCFLGYSYAHQENSRSNLGLLLLGKAGPLQSSIITVSNLPSDAKAFGQLSLSRLTEHLLSLGVFVA